MSLHGICTDSSYSWTYNSLNQEPCVVAAYLESVCTGGPLSVNDPLPPDYHYSGPWVAYATPCKCSTVYYSLIGACSACQDREYLTWSQWNTNCSAIFTTFPDPIPSGTRVPHWAYLPIESNDLWNAASARAALTGPESTPTTGPTSFTGYTSTTNYGGTFTTVIPGGNTGGGGGGSPKSKPTNVGAIVGGVVGGVVGLALVALLGIFLFRRRNSNQVAPSSTYTSQYPGPTPLVEEKSNLGYNVTGSTMVTPSPSLGGPMRLYNPSDPTTFPVAHDGAPGAGYLRGYPGGPEI